MSHTVQRCRFDEKFRRLPRECSGAQRRPKESLATKESSFRQTAPMIARVLFPPAATLVPDRPQVLIPLPGRARAVAMLPDLGVPTRRNDSLGPALCEHIVTPSLVIGPVGTDLAHLP